MLNSDTIKKMLAETREDLGRQKSIPVTHRQFISETMGGGEALLNGHAGDVGLLCNIMGASVFVMVQHILHGEKMNDAIVRKIMDEIKNSGAITPDTQTTRIVKALAKPLSHLGIAICIFLAILAIMGYGDQAAGGFGKLVEALNRRPPTALDARPPTTDNH